MSWSKLGASWSELGGWRELGASWSKGSKLGGWRKLGASWSELGSWRELGVSWSKGSKLEQAGRLERAGSELGVRGVSWEGGKPASACSHLAHSPLPPRGSRDPGMLWEQGEQAGEQGEPAGGFLRPMVVGTLKPSIAFVSLPSLQFAPARSQLAPSSFQVRSQVRATW